MRGHDSSCGYACTATLGMSPTPSCPMIQVSPTPLRAVPSIPPKGFIVSRPATPRQSPPRRLVVVSNRVALPGSEPSGGLAHGLRALLAARGGLWVGWSGRHGEQEDLHLVAEGKVEYLTLDLPRDEFDLYYREFANRALWPVLHDRSDLVACTGYARLGSRSAALVPGCQRRRRRDGVDRHRRLWPPGPQPDFGHAGDRFRAYRSDLSEALGSRATQI